MWRIFVDDPYLISQKMPHFSPKVKSALASKMLSVTILISRHENYSESWTNLWALCWVMVCGGASHSCICCNLAISSPFRSLLRHPDESCWGAECNCQASAVLFVFFLWQCSRCPALPSLRFEFPVHTTNHHASLPCEFGEGTGSRSDRWKKNADAERRKVMLWAGVVPVVHDSCWCKCFWSRSAKFQRDPFYCLFIITFLWAWKPCIIRMHDGMTVGLSSTLHACDLLSCSPKVNDAKYNEPFCHVLWEVDSMPITII